MNKTDFINEILAEVSNSFDEQQTGYLKMIFTVKLHDIDLVKRETALSTEVRDNEYILKRWMIDMLANGRSQKTITAYITTVRRFLQDTGKNFDEINYQDISDYLALKQYRDKISTNYKSTMNRYFSSFYKWAYKKHHTKNDVTREFEYIKPILKKKERLSDLEVQMIRDYCKNDTRELAMVDFLFSTGIRVGELSSLNIRDVDFNIGIVQVYGEKSREYRTVFLDAKALKHLKDYLATREDTNKALFVGIRKPNKRLENTALNSLLKKIGTGAGVSIKTTCHVFRKTFASTMYLRGVDIVTISRLLGHSSTEITLKYYLMEDLDDMRLKHNRAA